MRRLASRRIRLWRVLVKAGLLPVLWFGSVNDNVDARSNILYHEY
jgi:hypothetical protein